MNEYSIYKDKNILPFDSVVSDEGMSYAGIGSRKTPANIGEVMISAGYYLARAGLILRSGNAPGADQYFEVGADLAINQDPSCKKEIFIPKKDFFKTGNPTSLVYEDITDETLKLDTELIAGRFHKGWLGLPNVSKQLMCRNVSQVLGDNLKKPVDFVLCWTPDGCISGETRKSLTGGTGQAISIASHHNIEVFNLARDDHFERVMSKLNALKEEFGEVPSLDTLPRRPKMDYNKSKKRPF